MAGPVIKQLLSEYPDQIKLTLKHYPYKYRDYAEQAAMAVLAAGSQGKYWEMHDTVIANSPQLDRRSLVQYATTVGLDPERFEEDLNNEEHKKIIDRDMQLAESMHLYNTPTLFINGRKVIGYRSLDYLKKIVDEELAHVAKK